jgi:PAS domain S-box-containing protein
VKKVVIITFWSKVAQAHAQQLKKLFGKKIEIRTYSFDIDNITTPMDADIIIISLYSIYVTVKKYIAHTSQVVIVNTTITNEQYNQIMSILPGKKVMVVNYSSEMTMETIAQFNQLGIHHVDFIPVYPGITNIPKLEIAVTPGEAQYVPAQIKTVIDIGNRVLDTSTIVDVAIKLNLDYLLQEERFIDHFESLKSHNLGLRALLGRTNTLESELDSLLNVLDDGIIAVDDNGSIHAFNKRAADIIGCKKEEAMGVNFKDIMPQIPFDQVIGTSKSIRATLIKINECPISTTVVPVIVSKKTTGALAIINEFTEQEKNQHKLRVQLTGKGHRAKYRFEDIYGKSPVMIELKNMAERMARSESSVLISGETGTGKELFAQAIHNASRRKDYQFVAVNCAALPESLLESELFGYDEGSFTGARKGGKLGLFELAHKGTIFLDEIGEMALDLQARLLRVIQEREVMRIGGDRVIKIDIRVIAATNQDLKKLVKQGTFRKDLYYRLNVLPLETVPLRNSKEDIVLLSDRIKQELKLEFELSQDAMKAFKEHVWEGNVRELRNCIEYLAHLDKKMIHPSDIPFARNGCQEATELNDIDHKMTMELIKAMEHHEEKYIFVLTCLEDSLKNRMRIGRRRIVELAQEKEMFLSENEVRGILNMLRDYKMVSLANGRGGTQITNLGIKILSNIKAGFIG